MNPETPEHYDPDCCCAYCLDVSIARARRKQAAAYRDMRRKGKGRLARLMWKKMKHARKLYERAYIEGIENRLYYSDTAPDQGGLQSLLADT